MGFFSSKPEFIKSNKAHELLTAFFENFNKGDPKAAMGVLFGLSENGEGGRMFSIKDLELKLINEKLEWKPYYSFYVERGFDWANFSIQILGNGCCLIRISDQKHGGGYSLFWVKRGDAYVKHDKIMGQTAENLRFIIDLHP